jgi:hypothetical protein
VTAWTTIEQVGRALGTGVATDDYLADCVAAANAAAYRKRAEAGYTDDDDPAAPAPSPDVAMGATLWAVALWRERSSTDGYRSFDDLSGFQPTGGSWSTIKRLLGIGRAAVDGLPVDAATARLLGRRRRAARVVGW